MRHVWLIALAVLLPAQTTSDPPVFRATTRLVQISVVAHDRKGNAVSDLKKENFTITEEGKPQEIAFFTVQSSDKLAVPPSKLSRNLFSNLLEQRDGVPTSVSVILLDLLNTSWTDVHFARKAVIKYLQQIQPGDRIALYSLGRGLRVLHDYTTDASSLLRKINGYRGEIMTELSSSQVNPDEAQDLKDLGLDSLLAQRQREADFYTSNRVVNTLKSLQAIAQHLASLPGRKNLVWVSGGFPLMIGMDEIPLPGDNRDRRSFFNEAETAIRALNDAGISVYPVDARGLVTLPQFDASMANRGMTVPQVKLGPTVPHLDTMMYLADRTGGRAAFNTNDIERSIRRAIEDSRVTYSIAYYSTYEKQDGKFRDIKVKVDRPGIDIRHRKGYFAFRPVQATAEARDAELRTALWTPLDATAVRVNARVDKVDQPQPDTIHVFVQVDPSSIVLEKDGDRWKGKIDIMIAQKDETGKVLGKPKMDTLNMALLEKTYADIRKRGLIYQSHFPRESSAHTLRIIVRDITTGGIGTLTVPLGEVQFTAISEPGPPPKPSQPK